MSKSAQNDNRKKLRAAQNDNRATASGKRHPWADAIDGIDFGPAVAAVGDLAGWALDLAAADVGDWPEGARRVRNCRRYVLRRLRGKPMRGVPYEDILFTAGLLARIFEAEIGLGMSDMVAVLDKLGLPTEVVPIVPRVQPHARIAAGGATADLDLLRTWRNAMRILGDDVPDDPDVPPCCDACARKRHRNAA